MTMLHTIAFTLLTLAAPGETPEDLEGLLKNIWSPYCKGISLLECPSGQAEKLRDEIRARYFAGESVEKIRSDLSATYGGQLRMLPSNTGREGMAYWLPYLLFLVGVVAVSTIWWKSREKRNKPQNPATSSSRKEPLTEIDPKILEKIEKRVESL